MNDENERSVASEGSGAHVCKEPRYCCCSVIGLEPDEDCPIHGRGPWPPRCGECGKYMAAESRMRRVEAK